MKKVKEFASVPVVTMFQYESVLEAAKKMRERHVGNVVVVEQTDEGVIPVGILTDRDIVIDCVCTNRLPESVMASEVMSDELITVHEDEPLSRAIALMKDNGVRRIPIVNHQGLLTGIVSMDDLFAKSAKDLENLPREQRNWEREVRL